MSETITYRFQIERVAPSVRKLLLKLLRARAKLSPAGRNQVAVSNRVERSAAIFVSELCREITRRSGRLGRDDGLGGDVGLGGKLVREKVAAQSNRAERFATIFVERLSELFREIAPRRGRLGRDELGGGLVTDGGALKLLEH